MAATEVRMAVPGPWAQRRIAFHASSTYSSSPTMEPLNEPMGRREGSSGGGGSARAQAQQQQNQNLGKHGKSDPQSLPSSMPLQWTGPQKIGAGLSNLGNTCFLNSVLQCLTYTPPLACYLLSGQHKASCRVAGFCAFCALQEHVQQALASSGKVLSPQKLAKNLRCISRSFRMGRQEDSHEYMRYLLEALHKCCLPPDLAKNSNSKSSQEKSLVYRIFGGQLRSQVKCTVCSHCSNTYDPFLDLSLEIVRADSLTKALARFTAVDVLDGDNKYRCLRCKKKVRALKNFTIDTVPNILTIQFKRFSSNGGQGGKIDKRVEFGTTLDLKPFVSHGQDSVPKYKLFGVLVHSGWSTHSGHYYCFLRASSDIWHVFDDSRVRQVSEKTVLEQKAYMLFYVREGKRPSSEGKRPNSSHFEVTTNQQSSAQTFGPLPKARERKLVPEIIPRQILLSRPVTVLPKESESSLPTQAVAGQVLSEPVSAVSEERKVDTESEILPKPTLSQLPTPVPEGNGHDEVHPDNSQGVHSGADAIPTTSGGDHIVATAVTSVEIPGSLEELAVEPAPSVAESCGLVTEADEKTMDTENLCTTSGNSGVEDDWDEYYKKGLNVAGGTPRNLLKMLREIPHTRRFFQARAAPARRVNKVAGVVNGEVEMESSESCENMSANVKKDAKRQHAFNEEGRGSKRQQRDLCENGTSNSCVASEKTMEKMEHLETVGSMRIEPIVEESSSLGMAGNISGSARDVCCGSIEEPMVVERPLAVGVENGLAETPGDRYLHDQVNESLEKRESHSGAELRGDASIETQPSERVNGGVSDDTHGNECIQEKGAETIFESATPTTRTELYGTAVPRWDDVNGDKQLVNDIDRLLASDKESSYRPDIWDMEYDRGRSKKVRNKISRETHDLEISNGVGKAVSKSENPFQAFGVAKQNGGGAKAVNGYVAKVKNVGFGLQNLRSR